jgi:hypothetical protein
LFMKRIVVRALRDVVQGQEHACDR